MLFVSCNESANAKALYKVVLSENHRCFFIENETQLEVDWFSKDDKVGICGATSTPMWLMEQVKGYLELHSEQALTV